MRAPDLSGLALVFALALAPACGPSDPQDPTPPIPPSLELYVMAAPGYGGWNAPLGVVDLSTDGDAPRAITVPAGGETKGTIAAPLAEGEESPRLIRSRVLAYGDDGLAYRGLPEGDAFGGIFTLRAPAGLYDLWVEPHDLTRPPIWMTGVALPDPALSITSAPGELVTGRLTLQESGAGLTGVEVTTLNPETLRRSGGRALTQAGGAFSLQAPVGTHLLVAGRDGQGAGSPEAEPAPIPLTQLGTVTVPEGGMDAGEWPVTPPATEELVGSVTYTFRPIDGVLVEAERLPVDPPFGALTVRVQTGQRDAVSAGYFTLALPEGSYRLRLTPPTDTSDPLGGLLFQGGAPLTMFGASLDEPIPLPTLLTDIQGIVPVAGSARGGQGTSLLFLPDTAAQPPISAQARTSTGRFTVGVEPPGQLPITLTEGSPFVILSPPVGSDLVRQLTSVSVVQGQTELSIPSMETGYRAYGILESGTPGAFTHAVIKAVPPGFEPWGLAWGPGPDPRLVVAEAVVDEEGRFELVLPYP